jgi:atypical dual specificity phosphatase
MNEAASTEFSRLSLAMKIRSLGVYYPTLAYNVLLGRILNVRPWWTRIDDDLILGALPFASDVAKLHAEGVRGVVNTCIEYAGPTAEYERLGIEQLWVPTIDFTHPSIESVNRGVAFMDKIVAAGGAGYIHCKAGRGRSATIAVCWLMHSRGVTAEEAQRLLLDKRPHVNPRLAKRPVVREFASNLSKSS